MTRVAVIGEALVDVIHGVPHPGGSPVNVAVGLGRLGLDVTIVTRFGRDDHGRLISRHLAQAGATVAAGSVAETSTSTAHVVLDDRGAAQYDFDIVWDVASPRLDAYGLVHVGSIGAYLEPGASTVASALADVAAGTLVSFDPNIRPTLVGAHSRAVAQTERIAAMSHILKLSDEDAAWLYPAESLIDVLRRFRALGARIAVATRGPDGCLAIAGASILELPARSVAVADTVGAGDAFTSGLLAAIVKDDGAARVAAGASPVGGWAHVLHVALESAAIAVSRPGADPPWSAELWKRE